MSSAHPTHSFAGLSDQEVREFLQTHRLGLTVSEVRTIEEEILKRPPTLAELVLWSIQGSEHCSYKSSRSFLRRLPTEGPNVILGPSEDAGIVEVARDRKGCRYGVALSHESHNHPSQVVPYEGAATGVGGNVRDVLCMGAEVVALLDGLCFGSVRDPASVRIADGVVAGIGGYGNPLGIPNVGGFTVWDADYRDNCLVTVLTAGILSEERLIHSRAPADATETHVFILVGKPTDNSGFGGASFASTLLAEDDRERNKGAVQEPNAFLERHLLKSSEALFRELLADGLISKVGFKDLGAGGIACASVELADAAGLGAEIDLSAVPRGLPNLAPEVVLCSETQERFLWIVPADLEERILSHYNERFALPLVSEGACAARIGTLRRDGIYRVTEGSTVLVEAPARLVTQGLLVDRPFQARPIAAPEQPGPVLEDPSDWKEEILSFLASPAGRSRGSVYERYDKQVQGTVILEAGVADAGVLAPFNGPEWPPEIRSTGIALTLDHNPRLNRLDPWWGAVTNVLEAVRNIVAVGASPQCLTDCLCYGNPEKPEDMGDFVAGIEGICAAASALELFEHPGHPIPILSGNVSLYNESPRGRIPPSPIIGCLGVLPDAAKAMTPTLRSPGDVLIRLGHPSGNLGGSAYAEWRGNSGTSAPWPDLTLAAAEIKATAAAISRGQMTACKDLSEGGLLLAVVEMLENSSVGCRLTGHPDQSDLAFLFAEGGGFVLTVPPVEVDSLLKEWSSLGLSASIVGEVLAEPGLVLPQQVFLSPEAIIRARQGNNPSIHETH